MICWWQADLRDTDRLQYFAITKFNNCFIIRSPSRFSMNIFGQQSDLPYFTQERSQDGEKRGFISTEQNIICSQTKLDDITHEQTIICRQLFTGQMVGFRPMKRKKNLHRMII